MRTSIRLPLLLGVFLLLGCQDYPSAEHMPGPNPERIPIVHTTPLAAVQKVSAAQSKRRSHPRIEVFEYPERQVLELRIGPVDLDVDDQHHYRSPAHVAAFPFDGYLHGFDWKLTAVAPQPSVPDQMLHHFNIVSPTTRELFVPMAQRLLAAGRETSKESIPPVVGRPFDKGEPMVVVGKFHQATEHDWTGVVLHIYLYYTKKDERLVHPWAAQPFYLDVMSPTGQTTQEGHFQKDFPVPPGRTVKRWEGQPSVDGTIVGIGGHLHDYGTTLRLKDVTTGEVLWETHPVTNDQGHVQAVPSERFLWGGGITVSADHRYRFTAIYKNPLDDPSPHRGMGAIGGMIIPSAPWPEADTTHPTYRKELTSFMQ